MTDAFTDQLCGIVDAAVENAVTAAIGEARGWLELQPEGWARDGALTRIDKVRDGALSRLIREYTEQGLREWDHVPEQLRGNVKAVQAWERFAGRKPTNLLRMDCDWETRMKEVLFSVSMDLEAPAMWRGIGPDARTVLATDGIPLAMMESNSYWPEERRSINVFVRVDAYKLEVVR